MSSSVDILQLSSSVDISLYNSMEIQYVKLWQYRLWSFKSGNTKLERFLPKNQHTQRKLLNFENWCNGEVSKIGHHISNKVI